MSVVGFDIGNESCIVAVARQRGIDVVLNDESKRETPAIVCFGEKQRFIGTAGAASSTMNPKNSVSQIKRLIGRKFSDPELQLDLQTLPFSVSEGPDGFPLIHARYLGEEKVFTPTQILAMVLSNLKGIAEKNLNSAVVDCCIGIPAYFTDLQRRAVLDAATIVEYKIDVYQNARACIRLRAACEKLKKMLSANPEAPLNIECLMDEKDVRGFIKREEFEQISVSILERVKGPLEKALHEAGLTVDGIHSVEVVGSGSRVPAIIKILTDFFGKEPRRTMNASECVARGCALQCAILSPTFRVREFLVHESLPFTIALSWQGYLNDAQSGLADAQQSAVVFLKEMQFPASRLLHFIDLIGPFKTSKGDRAKLKVKVRLNLHGIVSIESATMLEEEEVDVPVAANNVSPNENAKMETDEATNNDLAGADINMQDVKNTADGAGVENGKPESENKPAQMETDTKAEAPKKKVKKSNVPVAETVYGAMAAVDVQKAVEKEFEMALQDRVMEETKDRKNAVEAYVYDMRNKLYDKYQEFVTDLERDDLIAKLQEVEDWLYEDGEDETKGVYVAKLDELKKQGDPIEVRHKEWTERGAAIEQLVYCISSYREAALSKDPKFEHIDIAEKQKVVNECSEAESWLRDKQLQQDALPKHATPAFFTADIKKKAETLDRFCRPIMTKPKPQPPKPQTPQNEPASPQPQTTEQHSHEVEDGTEVDTSGQTPASAASEPMETEGTA
ncbi:hypothetical protein HPP92_008693 [Vanilla planifolia]|uniref:Uncharacterized protein n=1 Tax=Vanilla planifolia TaxID=51239 RepID=A0A835V269_VANPL|nr:hypothetical protein HPP92_008693 [Vanilla planifolia]